MYFFREWMTFDQFEAMCAALNIQCRRGTEHIGDSVITFMYATGRLYEYKCDNISLWVRFRGLV